MAVSHSILWLRATFFAVLCCLLLPVALRAEQDPLPQPEGVVALCFDGDTFKLTDRRVVRLAGSDHKAQYYAREARQ